MCQEGPSLASGPTELAAGPVGHARPGTCLALALLAPGGQSGGCTGLPGHKEGQQLQVHVHGNVQEGVLPDEGVSVKVREEAGGKMSRR